MKCACGCGQTVLTTRPDKGCRYRPGHSPAARAALASNNNHPNDVPIAKAQILIERMVDRYGTVRAVSRVTGIRASALYQWRVAICEYITFRNYMRLLQAADFTHERSRRTDDAKAQHRSELRSRENA